MPKKINVIKKIGVKSDLRVGRCVQIRRGSCEAVEREIFTRPAIFKDFSSSEPSRSELCICVHVSWVAEGLVRLENPIRFRYSSAHLFQLQSKETDFEVREAKGLMGPKKVHEDGVNRLIAYSNRVQWPP